jgi:hypothetical protein
VTDATDVAIYFFGEGKTDLGEGEDPDQPTTGVLPILVHTVCGKPNRMRVRRRRVAHLQGKGLWQKVRFARWQARGNSDGAVFVMDSEGPAKLHKKVLSELHKGRDAPGPVLRMAVGVAHPCIEAWLLADASAIRRGVNLSGNPGVPDEPEGLPAPRQDDRRNPKTALAAACRSPKHDVAASEKWAIAAATNDMDLVRVRCPLGFAPFADEVECHIRALF